jgi:cytoskeletal protein RodZ
MSVSNRRFNREDRDRSPRLNIHAADSAAENDGAYYDGIGAELRAERIRCDLTLADVAHRLRIRESHLEAIEAGRFGDLPGRIYAIGFVRSYAEFLGADGDVCITMFKAEVGPGGHSRKLVFPAPPAENRRPGWLTLAASVALAAAVYGGWYVWQTDERQVAELVPEVPQRFVEQAEIAKVRDASTVSAVTAANASESNGFPVTGGNDRPVAQVVTETRTLDLAVVGRVQVRTDNAPELNAPSETDQAIAQNEAEPVVKDAAKVVAAEAAGSVAAAVDKTAPVQVTVSQVPELIEVPAKPAPAEEPVQLAVVAPPPPVPAAETQTDYVPRIFGIANRGSRVLVRATGQVQIIVKRLDGSIVMPHRVMQPGDIYRAPDRADVILEADKIGALQLIVDGKLIGRGDRLTEPGNGLALNAEFLKALSN